MINFALGFFACAVASVLWPKAAARIHDLAAKAVAWVRGLAKQGPAA